MLHICTDGKPKVLGVAAVAKREVGGGITLPAVPANPDQCPSCGCVFKEWTPDQIANQKAAYEARGGTWGKNPIEPVSQ